LLRLAAAKPPVELNWGEDLTAILDLVVPADGGVAAPKTDIGSGSCYFAPFLDTKGNKVGLHFVA
jgi:predicted enzyme related to lactoylglutathione lyase